MRCRVILLCITVELNLSGLTGTTSHPDRRKFRKIGFFSENKLQWHFEVDKNSTNGCFRLHIYLRTNKTLYVTPYMYLTAGGKICHKTMLYSYSREMFTGRAKTIRIIGDPDNWSSTALVYGEIDGWGTAIQDERTRVRSPLVWLQFFIGIILPGVLWSWVRLSL